MPPPAAPLIVVTGRVTDRRGLPLPFARVAVGSFTGFADINGNYRAVMPEGTQVVAFSFPGHQTQTREIAVRQNALSLGDAQLDLSDTAEVTGSSGDERLAVNGCRCGNPFGVDPLDDRGRIRPHSPVGTR